MIKNLIVIPVRLEATRLPNKALLEVNGKTILQHTYEHCLMSKEADHIVIATDSKSIFNHCLAKNMAAMTPNVTSLNLRCGTERMVDYIKSHSELGLSDYIDLKKVVSVQVDYPEIDPKLIDRVFDSIKDPYPIVSALYFNKHPKTDDVCTEFSSITNLCKSFSRLGDYANTHVGIYGFSAKILKVLDLIYKEDKSTGYDLEQNLWLDYGLNIRGLITDPTISINNQDDLDEFKKKIEPSSSK